MHFREFFQSESGADKMIQSAPDEGVYKFIFDILE